MKQTLITEMSILHRVNGAAGVQAVTRHSGQQKGPQVLCSPRLDLTTDSSQDSQGGGDEALHLPDVQHTVVRLPEQHQKLFDQMKQEQTALLRNVENVDQQVDLRAFRYMAWWTA